MATELQEALAASGVAPLIQKQIDSLLLEYMRRYSPLVATIPTQQWGSNVYYYNERTAKPAGGFVTDGGARAQSSSTYVQNSFTIKLLQSVGGVTGFAQAVTRDLIGDLKAREVEGAVSGLLWDIENAILWGNATATLNGSYPQFDGLDALVSTYSGSTQNAIDEAGATITLKLLDSLIDMVEENSAMPAQGEMFALVLSPKMVSSISQLLTNQQRFVNNVEVAAGLIVPSYRDIPLVKSSFLSPRSNQMGAVTGGASGTGALPAATYKYYVSAVMARFGETLVQSTEVSQAASGSNLITLSFSTPSGPDGAGPVAYKVYRTAGGGAANTETLLGVVDAYDTTGTATTVIQDSGTNLLTNSLANTGPSAYVGTNAGVGPRQQSSSISEEEIFLIPRDPNFLVRPFVRDLTVLNLAPTVTAPDTLPFAIVSDTTLAVRAPKYVGRLSRVCGTF